jgi:hypothetical protein
MASSRRWPGGVVHGGERRRHLPVGGKHTVRLQPPGGHRGRDRVWGGLRVLHDVLRRPHSPHGGGRPLREVLRCGNVPSIMPNVPSIMPNVPSIMPNVPSMMPNIPSIMPNVP